MTDITMTKEGGFYYRALSFHWVFVASVFPFATIAIVLAVINPFWFREDMFRWMYDNLELWSTTQEGQDQAILTIRKGLVQHSQCADPEINLSATLVELTQIN